MSLLPRRVSLAIEGRSTTLITRMSAFAIELHVAEELGVVQRADGALGLVVGQPVALVHRQVVVDGAGRDAAETIDADVRHHERVESERIGGEGGKQDQRGDTLHRRFRWVISTGRPMGRPDQRMRQGQSPASKESRHTMRRGAFGDDMPSRRPVAGADRRVAGMRLSAGSSASRQQHAVDIVVERQPHQGEQQRQPDVLADDHGLFADRAALDQLDKIIQQVSAIQNGIGSRLRMARLSDTRPGTAGTRPGPCRPTRWRPGQCR